MADYATIVRAWSVKRRLESEARRVLQQALNPDVNAAGLAASVVTRFASIRDIGSAADDITALTVAELLEQSDDEPDWLIPGLLERRDRLMLTGEEGLGKSHWLRQFAVHAAAGLTRSTSPGASRRCGPRSSTARTPGARCAARSGRWSSTPTRYGQDPAERVMVDCTSRMDITRDRDLSRIHRLLDAQQPDLVIIGPLYRLVPRALQTDDDTAPVLAALDTIRDRGCALMMEAHAGHAIGEGGLRDLRPRGSSSLLGWPEFGYGMRHVAEGYADLVQWRGPREERDWPTLCCAVLTVSAGSPTPGPATTRGSWAMTEPLLRDDERSRETETEEDVA